MLWKKATILGAAGFVLGGLIGICLMQSSSAGWKESLPHVFAGAIYGATVMGSSVIYEIEKWSITRATVTHFLLVFALYFLISLFLGWFRLDDAVFWIVIAGMTAIYVIVWLIQFSIYKKKVQEMNAGLEKWKSGNNT